jgi:hypothetical protein
MGFSEEAIKDLEKAIVLNGTNNKIFTNLAIIKRKEG